MILTVSYSNEQVALKSYSQLIKTMRDDPCKVYLFDNRYPLNSFNFIHDICHNFRFEYYSHRQNIGLYEGYRFLLSQVNGDENVILYDGDSYPMHDNWHKAILEVLDDPTVATVCLANTINQRELTERGYDHVVINGHRCKVSHQAITCTVSGWNLPWLRSIGGITSPNNYYGGNEIEMWEHYGPNRKFVVLDDFWENLTEIKKLQDWQYEEYKLLYAHKGLGMSFEEYLKTNPQQYGIDNLLTYIFG